MIDDAVIDTLRRKVKRLYSELDERARRHWAASEAIELGHGGIQAVATATGLSERTIRRGCQELQPREAKAVGSPRWIRRPGGGRKPLQERDSQLVSALEALVEPTARGDPRSPLRWTCKSTRKLAQVLTRQGHVISHSKVAQLLGELEYSLQGTRKTLEGQSHPERDAQFRYINRRVKALQKFGQPVISVDAKKKPLVGVFAKGGGEYQPQGRPELVRMHDFPDKQLGKVCP